MNRTRTFVLLTLTALGACYFAAASHVAATTDAPAAGVFAVDHVGDYVYVGSVTTGDRWGYADTLQVFEPDGTPVRTSGWWTGPYGIAAVASDPDDDSVWTLHKNGALRQWSSDLSTILYTDNTAFSTAAYYGERFCDLAVAPGGLMIATTVESPTAYSDYGNVYYLDVDTTGSHSDTLVWAAREDVDAFVTPSCPRVDVHDGKVYTLFPDYDTYPGPVDLVLETPLSTKSVGGTLVDYPAYATSNPQFTLTQRSPGKFSRTDIAANDYGMLLVESSLYGSAYSYADMVEFDGTIRDTDTLRDIRGIDIAPTAPSANEYIWWSGQQNMSSSTEGLGTWGITLTTP